MKSYTYKQQRINGRYYLLKGKELMVPPLYDYGSLLAYDYRLELGYKKNNRIHTANVVERPRSFTHPTGELVGCLKE